MNTRIVHKTLLILAAGALVLWAGCSVRPAEHPLASLTAVSEAAAPPSPTASPLPATPTLSSLPSLRPPSPTPLPTDTQPPTPPPPTLTPTPSPQAPQVVPAVVRGPYLQRVTPHSVLVVWETDVPSHAEVVCCRSADASHCQRWSAPTPSTRQAVTLTGLAPYTVYTYYLTSNGIRLSQDIPFRTAAPPGQDAFHFVVLGDTRTQHDVHRSVVAQIAARTPDFILHTGDLVEHGASLREWDTFFEIERPLLASAPLFPVLGNHEGNHAHYFDLFYLPGNERWYTFDYGTARFVALQVDGIAPFDPRSEQYAWLEETLRLNTQPWLFVYFHIPPYSALREDKHEIAVRQALAPLFEQAGVDIVFTGHHHDYQRSEVGGVTYIVTGGGGAPLYAVRRPERHTLAYANAYHFVHITVDGDQLTGVAIAADGSELDRFTLRHHERRSGG